MLVTSALGMLLRLGVADLLVVCCRALLDGWFGVVWWVGGWG